MSLTDQRVLVTGANGGLGLATTIRLLKEGAHVVLACRSEDRAREARAHALSAAQVPPDRATAMGGFDMLDPAAIRESVATLGPDRIDVVFLQAGGWVYADVAQTVQLGGAVVEKTVAKNVVGAHATLRALWSTDRLAHPARVVLIGGEGARGVPGAITPPTFDGVEDYERTLRGGSRRPYVPVDALGVSKLAAAHWVQALASRAEGRLEVVWFTPGLIGGTGGTAGMPAYREFLFQRIVFPLLVAFGKAQWPDAAAAKCVACLAGRVGNHGDLIGAPAGTALGPLTDQKPMSPLFGRNDLQEAVWALCEQAAGPMPTLSRAKHSA